MSLVYVTLAALAVGVAVAIVTEPGSEERELAEFAGAFFTTVTLLFGVVLTNGVILVYSAYAAAAVGAARITDGVRQWVGTSVE